jgi:RNA polymerase sigma factor (sigma-70 family)
MESTFYQELFAHFMAAAWKEAPTVARDQFLCREIFHDRILFPPRVASMTEAEARLKGIGREFRDPAAYRNFLYTVFKNAIIDHLRERQRSAVRTEPVAEDCPLPAPDRTDACPPERLRAAADRIFPTLTREECRLLTLRYMKKKTLVEIGKVLHLSKSTVDRRERLLSQKLFAALGAHEEFEEEDLKQILELLLNKVAGED